MKKIGAIALGSVLAFGALSLAACGEKKIVLPGDYAYGAVESNGGFVVEKGNYIYFINGKESYTAENSNVVKGSLMRISVNDFKMGNYTEADVVVPSLMVTANYDAGVYIYGDRVYYATPTTAKDIDGEVRNSYLDFKSTRLNGTDTTAHYYFRSSSNSAKYRYTEVNGVVYCLHVDGNNVYSYNTATGVDTLLVKDTTSVLFDNTSTTSGRIYYTMDVTVDIDTENAYKETYNQVYTVTADKALENGAFDAKEASYTVNGKTYDFDKDFLEDYDYIDFDAKDLSTYPYVNLGTLVFDGKGSTNVKTQFNAEGESFTPSGYQYTLVQAKNGGVYYTRSYVDTTSSSGDGGWLLYLPEDALSSSWNALSGNFGASNSEKNEVVAYSASKASSSAIFLRENGKNSYLYVDGNAIYRADTAFDGASLNEEVSRIVNSASGATLLFTEENAPFGYLYYSMTSGNGNAIYRAVYNGTAEDYNAILGNEDYQPVRILEAEYASSWYLPEVIENKIVYTNSESVGGTARNYVAVAETATASGMKTNSQIAALNEEYASVKDTISSLESSHKNLANLLQYYFYTNAFTAPAVDASVTNYYGTANNYFDAILQEAADRGFSSTYLYSDLYQSEFKKILAHEKGELADYTFTNENGEYYGNRSYFYGDLGEMTESEAALVLNTYQTGLVLTLPAEEEGLETWQWVLIGVGIGLGVLVVAAGVTIPLVVMNKKKKQRLAEIESAQPGIHHIEVDTTDDKDIDVYADEPISPDNEVEESTEPVAEEPTQESPVEAETAPEETTADESVAEETPVEEEKKGE